MTILNLLKTVAAKYERPPHPCLYERKQSIRGSYLTGLAMQAHADEDLDPYEQKAFLQIAKAFDLSEEAAVDILNKARNPTEATVDKIREDLLHSNLKFYFILDLQIMAHQDSDVKPVESDVLGQFGKLLDIDPTDIEFLVELADAVVEEDPEAKKKWTDRFFARMSSTSGEAGLAAFAHYTAAED